MPPTVPPRAARPARRGSSPERSTIEEVASAAGVSVATVSRALRGLPNVATTTRQRVTDAAQALNYRADPFASRLATGRSRTIGVVVPLINSWYFSNVVAGAEAVCAEVGYDLLVLTAPDPALRHEVVSSAASLDRRVDGLIFVEVALPHHDVDHLVHSRLGVVTVGQQTGRFPSIFIDNAAVGRLAMEHLLALGHRRIGVLGAQAEDPAHFDVPGRRILGARQALAAAGLELDPALVAHGEFTVEGGLGAGDALLSSPDRPTAIFAMSDEMAFGAIAAARALGLDVPQDVSIIGVDDHDLAPAMGLTTIRQRVGDHGAMAARALLGRLDGTSRRPERLVGAVELVTRTSTQSIASRI